MNHNIYFYILSAFGIVSTFICSTTTVIRLNKKTTVYHIKNIVPMELVTVFASMLLSISTLKSEELNTLLVFSLMVFLGLIYNITYINEILVFDDDVIVKRNFLGFKRTFKYSDILSYKIKKHRNKYDSYHVTIFYTKDKKFAATTASRNYSELFKKINDEHKKLNNGKNLPINKTSKL